MIDQKCAPLIETGFHHFDTYGVQLVISATKIMMKK